MGIDWTDVEALEAQMSRQLPGFAVQYKDESRLQQTIATLVRPFNARYLSDYTTVMFGKVYFPSRAWRDAVGPERIYATLRHEAVHLSDMRRFPILFQVSYLFLLPAGLSMRAWWEWRAYAETLRVEAELRGEIDDALLEYVAQRFTGADYLFMFPFPRFVRRRLERLRRRILDEVRAA